MLIQDVGLVSIQKIKILFYFIINFYVFTFEITNAMCLLKFTLFLCLAIVEQFYCKTLLIII